MNKFLSAGFKLDHIDFHVCQTPRQVISAMKLAKKYNLPMRAGDKDIESVLKQNGITYASNHIPDFYDHAHVDTLLGLLQESLDNKLDIVGFSVHPAYVDQVLPDLSSYNIQELKSLIF